MVLLHHYKIPSLNRATSAGIGLSDYLELTLGFYLWVREELINLAIVFDKPGVKRVENAKIPQSCCPQTRLELIHFQKHAFETLSRK